MFTRSEISTRLKRQAILATGLFVFAVLAVSLAGQAGEGLVALTTAAPSCDDGSGDIYVDCGNGTVTDTRSGLVWLKNAKCFNATEWHDAMLTTAGLSTGRCGLTDGSAPGDWRLPTRDEWEAMTATATGCSPFLTNDDGTACWSDDPAGSSFENVQTAFYFSATTSEFSVDFVYFINMFNGFIDNGESKTGEDFFWPVRGGQ